MKKTGRTTKLYQISKHDYDAAWEKAVRKWTGRDGRLNEYLWREIKKAASVPKSNGGEAV